MPYQGDPVCLDLTEDARARFAQWHHIHCEKAEQPTFPPFLRAVYSKLKGYCARLALVHALASNPAAKEVHIDSVENAIKLVAYFETQARRVMPLIRDTTLFEVDSCKAEIQRKLSGCRSMKRRNLQRNSAFPAEVFNQALYELACPGLVIDIDGTVSLFKTMSLYVPTNRQVVEPELPSAKQTQVPVSDQTEFKAEHGQA